jgi:hypothetical protein
MSSKMRQLPAVHQQSSEQRLFRHQHKISIHCWQSNSTHLCFVHSPTDDQWHAHWPPY